MKISKHLVDMILNGYPTGCNPHGCIFLLNQSNKFVLFLNVLLFQAIVVPGFCYLFRYITGGFFLTTRYIGYSSFKEQEQDCPYLFWPKPVRPS